MRGYPIQELIGTLRFPDMIWLMLRGEVPEPAQSRLLEAALVAAVDHGPHAPSIAIARMAVTCGLPLNGAMASAINALDDVHGGAGQQCMELFERDRRRRRRRRGERRCHRRRASSASRPRTARSSRASAIAGTASIRARCACSRWCARPSSAGVVRGRFARIAEGIERQLTAQKGGRPIPMNIDGATAVIYSELGFAPELGRGLFILSRSVGILAHAWEQTPAGRPHQGTDVARDSLPLHGAGAPHARPEGKSHEATHLAPARQVPRRPRRRIPLRPLRPHEHRRPRRAARTRKIKFVNTRHEQIAAHIADGYARAKRTTAVVLSHLGPGLTNASTGVANAALDSIPMVVIAGDIPSHYYGKHPHQEVNLHADASQSEIYRPFVKRVWRVERPDLFPEIIEKAFQLAESGRPGPVLVSVPMDIFSMEVDTALFERLVGAHARAAQAVDGRADRREDRARPARGQERR